MKTGDNGCVYCGGEGVVGDGNLICTICKGKGSIKMNTKQMLKLSKKRSKILDDLLKKMTLVEKGKIKLSDRSIFKLMKELDSIQIEYRKALKS